MCCNMETLFNANRCYENKYASSWKKWAKNKFLDPFIFSIGLIVMLTYFYVNKNFKQADVIHYHNRYIKFIDLKLLKIKIKHIIDKPSFILYHSYPEITDNFNDIVSLNIF